MIPPMVIPNLDAGDDEEWKREYDGWRRWMHSRCDPAQGINCPWCDEFNAEKDER